VIETHEQRAISGAVGFAKERRYFVSGKMSFLAEALIVRGKKSAEYRIVEGANWRRVLKRFHTRACEWKAEAKMIILIAWTTYAAGMGLL
jgi:hypothetical protein